MVRLVRALVLSAIFAVGACSLSFAQAPGPQRPNGAGFGAMREQSKYTFQLMRMVRHIEAIDKNKKYTLTPAQAKQVLAVMNPIRSKPKLTQDQAKAALKKLKAIFTVDQLNAMAAIKDPPRRMGPGGGPGGPRPGGGPGGPPPGAQMRPPDPNTMKDFNPFYSKAKPSFPGQADRKKRTDEFFKGLATKAKSAGKPPAKPPAKK